MGGVNFKDLAVSLGTDPAGAPILVKYGMFLQNIFDFIIIAAAIFMAIKAINRLKAPPPAPSSWLNRRPTSHCSPKFATC